MGLRESPWPPRRHGRDIAHKRVGSRVHAFRHADSALERQGLELTPAQASWALKSSGEANRQLALRLPRDHYVRLDANDYSLHPAVICRRSWVRHQVITDPEHKAAAAALRRQRVGMLRPVGPEPKVEQRSLATALRRRIAGGEWEPGQRMPPVCRAGRRL